MKFDTPATTNPIDQLKVVGKPTSRIDGPLKTTGTAPYAYERHDVAPDAAYGYIVGAGIAKGRIAAMDVKAARAAPGVLAVVTARSAGKLGKGKFNTATLLGGPEIEHYHQAVALVVANSFEQARAAAALVHISYVPSAGQFSLAEAKDGARPAKSDQDKPATKTGDFAGRGSLLVDGEQVGEGDIPRFTASRFSLTGAGLSAGRDASGLAVCDDYVAPFPFTGEILGEVTVEVEGPAFVDPDAEAEIAITTQ